MKEDWMVMTYSLHGELRNAYKILVGNPYGTRLLEQLGVGGS
jgi:hypothetical protein